ncbi:MAG: hypothetical protein ACXW1N_08010 [Halobacteriota archaeon]
MLFVASLAIIFAGSSLFTNGVEWVGCKFKFSEGVVGSVLAAKGTALPETIAADRYFLCCGTDWTRCRHGGDIRRTFYVGDPRPFCYRCRHNCF